MTSSSFSYLRRILLIVLVIAEAAGMLGCSHPMAVDLAQLSRQFTIASDPNSGIIEASGTIEAEQVAMSAELGGRIISIPVQEGQEVTQGQVLVQIDDQLLVAQIAQAQAALGTAEAELARVLAGPRPAQIAGAKAAIEQAKAKAAGAKQAWDDAIQLRDNPLELDAQIRAAEAKVKLAQLGVDRAQAALSEAKVRYEGSKGGGSDIEKSTQEILRVQVEVAQANLELAQQAVRGAQATLAELRRLRANPAALEAAVHRAEIAYRLAEAEVKVKETSLALLEAGPLPEEVALAQRKVDLARAEVDKLETQRAKLTLRAPMDGVITSKVANEGETAVPGVTLLTIANLSKVRLVIYVPESQIGRVRLGQTAEVRVDAYPDRVFAGRVIRIATQAEFTPRNVQTKEERINTVFAVKIELENPERILKPGMPADAMLKSP